MEPPFERDHTGLGSNLKWAFGVLGAHLATLVGVTLVICGIWVGVAVFDFVVGLIINDQDIELLSLVGLWLILMVSLVAGIASWNILTRTWHSIALGTRPDLRWVLRPDRIAQVIAGALLLAPVAFVPLAGGFALVGFYYLVGEELPPTEAFSEMISRCTGSSRAFWHTVTIGFFITLYLYALAVLLFAIGSINTTVSISQNIETYVQSSETDATTLVLGFLVLAAIAIPLAFSMLHASGLWGVAWARRLTGRPIGAHDLEFAPTAVEVRN